LPKIKLTDKDFKKYKDLLAESAIHSRCGTTKVIVKYMKKIEKLHKSLGKKYAFDHEKYVISYDGVIMRKD